MNKKNSYPTPDGDHPGPDCGSGKVHGIMQNATVEGAVNRLSPALQHAVTNKVNRQKSRAMRLTKM